jgi:large subunit ribosomal protein L30
LSASAKRKTKTKAQRKPSTKARAPRKPATLTKKREAKAPIPPAKKEPAPEKKSYFLAIRLKGGFGTPRPLARALETLRLRRKFNAVLLENTPASIGMLRIVKDYITWGQAGANDIAIVLRERGEFSDGREVTDEAIRDRFGEGSIQDLALALTQGRITLRDLRQKGLSLVFRLHPPSGGFEGSGKRVYGSGGELGRRQGPLENLLARMT